jgi:hypothetical protein
MKNIQNKLSVLQDIKVNSYWRSSHRPFVLAAGAPNATIGIGR